MPGILERLIKAISRTDPQSALKRGVALYQAEHFTEAVKALRQALPLPNAHEFLGRALAATGDYNAAIPALDVALRENPGSVHAHLVRGFCLLATGDYGAGWPEYDWRWHRPEMQAIRNLFKQEWWDGSAIQGRTLLLFAEQGLGDAIQSIRFAPALATATGARIAVDCHPPLKGLFSRVPGVAEVLASDDDIPRYDLCFPLMSVPRVLGTTLQSIPNGPYLRASEEHAAKWRGIMPRTTERRVGLCWASQTSAGFARRKSVALQTLAPLLRVPGVAFYSLQLGAEQHASVIDLTSHIEDFSDTAGLIANLDLVISIDTSVAHLAGAMGKPTWALLRKVPDWRWEGQGAHSRWYPTMRLFRQAREGDWASLMPEVGEALRLECPA